MKPTKNKVFCKNCERTKMLFETEKKAENFIKFNKEEIESESGYSPQRSYYCVFCGGWHTTSLKEKLNLSRNERMFEQYIQEKETIITKNNKPENKEDKNKKIKNLENKVKEMNISQKEMFFLENIDNTKKEIEQLCSNNNIDKIHLKELRQNLEILYIVRKQNGLKKTKSKLEEIREKEIEEWQLWAKKKGY
jgi:uncharacterized membrane protein YhiD involved in acid resistance